MKLEFVATKVTCEINTEENYYLVGFSDNEDGPNQYVIIEKAINFDEQDIELGMDTYYFEYSGQSYSGYGICENVAIDDSHVYFELRGQVFDDIESIEITFNRDALTADWGEFKTVFDNIFSNN